MTPRNFPQSTEQVGTSVVETTVLANNPVLGDDIGAASPDQMLLARTDSTTFLIHDGVRAPIDPTDPILRNALHLGNDDVRQVSPGLLNSFQATDPILPIAIEGDGEATAYLSAYRVGSILRSVDSRGGQLYVVLREGLQPISAATADIIRYGNPQSPTVAEPISPALLNAVPIVNTLNVDQYPAESPRLVSADSDPVVCMSWQRGHSEAETTRRLLVGHRLPLPNDAQPVRLATADSGGPGLDAVYLKPGTGEYVQATGAETASRATGQLFYISDLGLRFHINDVPTATALGVVGTKEPAGAAAMPQSAPWPVLSLLPPGPELSQQAALIAHDGMAADSAGVKVTPPSQG